MSQVHLWLKVYGERPMFGKDQLDSLHDAIIEMSPQWATEMRVAPDESFERSAQPGPYFRLHQCVHEVAPPRRNLGSAVVTGPMEGINLYVDSCGSTLPPELNCLTVEILNVTEIGGRTPGQWALKFFTALLRRIPVRYGNISSTDEYDAKNMIRDADGTRAVGTHLEKAIPGLYWINFFGKPYVELIGRDKLLTAPASYTTEIQGGVLLILGDEPDEWQGSAYKDRERHVVEHIGPQFFFSREHPERKTIAPNFRAERNFWDSSGAL